MRANHAEPLIVIWDNGPAHGGDALRAYLATPDLRLRLVRLPAYSPDFNPDEAIWAWVREEVTANTCFGTKAKVQQQSAPSSPAWPSAPPRSSAAAAASCKRGRRPRPPH